MNAKVRGSAFAAFGALCNFGFGAQYEAFVEQVCKLCSFNVTTVSEICLSF